MVHNAGDNRDLDEKCPVALAMRNAADELFAVDKVRLEPYLAGVIEGVGHL